MSPTEIAFLIVIIAFLVSVYLTFRVIRECDDNEEEEEEEEDIWS